MKNQNKISSLILLFLILPAIVNSKGLLKFQHLTTDDGLSMNNVLDVTRDRNIGATNVLDLCVEIENALKSKQIETFFLAFFFIHLSEDILHIEVVTSGILSTLFDDLVEDHARVPYTRQVLQLKILRRKLLY